MSSNQLLLLLQIIKIIRLGVGLSKELKQSYDKSMKVLETAIAEDRDPTEAEWQELNSNLDKLHNKLQGE
jgi:hypothetical protein